jgi:hypothetical protein
VPHNPDTYHLRSIRLRGYDYSLLGEYDVTVCYLLHLPPEQLADDILKKGQADSPN